MESSDLQFPIENFYPVTLGTFIGAYSNSHDYYMYVTAPDFSSVWQKKIASTGSAANFGESLSILTSDSTILSSIYFDNKIVIYSLNQTTGDTID